MASQADIITEFYAIVGTTASSSVYPSATTGGAYVENLSNRIQDTICRKRPWWFLKKKTLFKTAIDTTLAADITTASTSISITSASTNFPTSGAILINGEDIVNYTGRTTTTLTGVTNIDIAHGAAETIEPIYAMPSDFSLNPILYIVTNFSKKKIRYDMVNPEDDTVAAYDHANSNFGSQQYRWSMITDKDGTEYIRVNNPSNESDALFQYIKAPASMTSSVASTIPDPFALKIIPLEMAKTAMLTRADNPDGLATEIGADAATELKNMENYDFRRVQGVRPRIKSMYGSGINSTGNQRIRYN